MGVPASELEQNKAETPNLSFSFTGWKQKKSQKSGKSCLVIFLVALVILVPGQSVSFTRVAPFNVLVQTGGNQDTK